MLKDKEDIIKYHSWIGSNAIQAVENILNEYKMYKRLAEANLKDAEEFENNMCEHRCLLKSEIEDIIDECIPKKKNIITGEEEYIPDTNANSYLTQKILKLFEKED